MRRITRIALAASCLLYCGTAAAEPTAAEFNSAWREYSAAVETGDADKALSASEQVLEMGRQLFPETDARLPVLMSNHATALNDAGRKDEAQDVFKASIKLAESIHGKDSMELVDPLMAQADASHSNEPGEAPTATFRRVLRIYEKHYGKESMEYAGVAFLAASELLNESGSLDGKSWMREAYEIFAAAGESRSVDVGAAAFYLGRMAFWQQQERTSVKYLLEAVDKLDPEIPAARALSLPARALLVRTLEDQGRSEEATEHCIAIGRDSMFRPNQDYLPVFRMAPRYPQSMLQAGRQGHVDLSFTVDENGFVRDPVVFATSETPAEDMVRTGTQVKLSRTERYFADAAIEAVERFRYAPRFEDGQAVATENVKTRISFKITN